MPIVDNSAPASSASSPEPAATQEPITQAAPTAPTEPAAPQIPAAQPGVRDINVLRAILDGAENIQQPPAAAEQPGLETPPEPGAQPAQTGQEPVTEPQVIPDKFRNPDGTLNAEALLKSYVGLEGALGRQGQQLGQMQQLQNELQQYRTYIIQTQLQAQQQAAAQQQKQAQQPEPKYPWEVEMTPEEQEKFQEEFLDNPVAALTKRDQQTAKAIEHKFQKMLEQVVSPLTPVIQEHQYRQEVQHYSNRLMALAQQHPDIYEVQPAMEVIAGSLGKDALRAMEKSGQDPLQVVYEAAKKLHKPAQPERTPEQLLSDQDFRQQVIQNPDIKNDILKAHMQSLQQGKPPQVIGSQPGGTPPATPSIAPKSANEAGVMLRKHFGL